MADTKKRIGAQVASEAAGAGLIVAAAVLFGVIWSGAMLAVALGCLVAGLMLIVVGNV